MIELPWGDSVLPVPIPSGWRLLGNFLPGDVEPAGDPETLCAAALANPFSAEPLASRDLRGRRVLIVADDATRPTPVFQFFGAIRKALVQAGAQARDIEILFALGVHRPMTNAEAEAKIGKENIASHRWHNHDCADPAQLVHVGRTSRGTPVVLNRLLSEFDLLVTIGTIQPHLLAGFSGGCKMIVPGCAAAETIGRNHLWGVTGAQFNHVGVPPADSPMRLDLEEAVRMLGNKIFSINAVLNRSGNVASFFCGDPEDAFRAGAAFARKLTEISVPEPADVVITNSRPLDNDLRQGLKCVGNTLYAARPGGAVLAFLHCADGRGDLRLPAWTVPYPLLRLLLHLPGNGRLLHFSDWLLRHEPVEEKFLRRFGLEMLRRNHLWFFGDSIEPDTGRRLGLLRQFSSVKKMIAAAVRKFGRRARVAVFPFGGACYAPDPFDALSRREDLKRLDNQTGVVLGREFAEIPSMVPAIETGHADYGH